MSDLAEKILHSGNNSAVPEKTKRFRFGSLLTSDEIKRAAAKIVRAELHHELSHADCAHGLKSLRALLEILEGPALAFGKKMSSGDVHRLTQRAAATEIEAWEREDSKEAPEAPPEAPERPPEPPEDFPEAEAEESVTEADRLDAEREELLRSDDVPERPKAHFTKSDATGEASDFAKKLNDRNAF